jgi:hypothetical protein
LILANYKASIRADQFTVTNFSIFNHNTSHCNRKAERGWWVNQLPPVCTMKEGRKEGRKDGWMDGWMISDHSNSFLLSSSSLANHGG